MVWCVPAAGLRVAFQRLFRHRRGAGAELRLSRLFFMLTRPPDELLVKNFERQPEGRAIGVRQRSAKRKT
jgi:hypothetical protein